MSRYFIVLLFLTIESLFAQTDSLNIFWNKNPESDMYQYLLQRSVNSFSDFQNYIYLLHPDTNAVDNNVQPGNLYAYRVAAMDSAGNLSNFSGFGAVGIPEILWTKNIFASGRDTFLVDSSFLMDPDNQVNLLQISVSQEIHVNIIIQDYGIRISPSPINYVGPASFILQAKDPEGFFDREEIQISFSDQTQIFDLELQISQIRSDAVRFIIASGTPTVIQLSYWYDISETISIEDSVFEVFHSIVLENLIADTTYHFDLIITDLLGNQIAILDSSFYVEPSFPSGNKVVVYPNPLVYQSSNNRIIFDNLPAEARKVLIFNILGQKVFEQKIQNLVDNSYYLYAFDGKPLDLASGVYIYIIEASRAVAGKTGKFSIIR